MNINYKATLDLEDRRDRSLTLLLTQREKHTDFNKWVVVPVPMTPMMRWIRTIYETPECPLFQSFLTKSTARDARLNQCSFSPFCH
jgi:hypothetical protein